jgi:hypothetical protein
VVLLVDTVSLWQALLPVLRFSPVRIIPPTSHTALTVPRRRDATSTINSVANNTFKRTTFYSKRSESSSALLWGPYTSHRMRFLHAKCLFHGESNYDSHSSFITSPYSIIYSFAICLRCFSSTDRILLKYDLQEDQRVPVYTLILFTLQAERKFLRGLQFTPLHEWCTSVPVYWYNFVASLSWWFEIVIEKAATTEVHTN